MRKVSFNYRQLIYLPILFLIAINLLLTPHFSPTWDFPYHYIAGLYRLGEAQAPVFNVYAPYGVFSEIVPIFFSRLFPTSWFPSSYLLYIVLAGTLGVVYFFRFVKAAYGDKIALLSTITLLLLPRFIGHLHTNIKDLPTASFIIITSYYFYQYLMEKNKKSAILAVIFYTFAVNTKFTILQLYPVYLLWMIFHYRKKFISKSLEPISKLSITRERVGDARRGAPKTGFPCGCFWGCRAAGPSEKAVLIPVLIFLSSLIIVPLLVWALYCLGYFSQLLSTYSGIYKSLSLINPFSYSYAIKQFFITTPIPILVFFPFGLFVLFKKIIKEHHSPSFFFLLLFVYTLFKYPLLRFPVIDDIRYFIEIYFPLSLAFVLGVNLIAKKYALFIYAGVFIFLSFVLIHLHPYQINYFNLLAPEGRDGDFWAASYKEVFAYINASTPKEAIVAAPLAPELAGMYIRADLAKNLNALPPEKSDVVVILNRPSSFRLWKLEDFYNTHRPQKIVTDPTGNPLSFIYFNTKP